MEENKDDKGNLEEQEQPEEKEEQEEDYSFMQETIKDEPGSAQRLRRDILRMIGLGVLLGVVACITFCVCRPWLESRINREDPETVTIPQDEEEEEEEEEEEKEEEELNLDADSYTQMLQSLHEVSAEISKSVVGISGYAKEEDWSVESEEREQSVTGVIVADNGLELLIFGQNARGEDIEEIQVTFVDGKSAPAVIKSQDMSLGFSIYAVTKSEIDEDTSEQIEVAYLGNSNMAREGDTALVIGKPFGNADTVSYGIVSSGDNYYDGVDGRFSLVYTDVAGSEEASGIIADVQGEVIGVIDQTVSEQEGSNLIIGYGISDLKDVIELLSNGSQVPYIGICGMDVTEEMEKEDIPQGMYVKEVEVDSPAMEAGIQSGDVLIRMGSTSIQNCAAYRSALMKLGVDSEVTLTVERQGSGGEYKELDFDITVAAKE